MSKSYDFKFTEGPCASKEIYYGDEEFYEIQETVTTTSTTVTVSPVQICSGSLCSSSIQRGLSILTLLDDSIAVVPEIRIRVPNPFGLGNRPRSGLGVYETEKKLILSFARQALRAGTGQASARQITPR